MGCRRSANDCAFSTLVGSEGVEAWADVSEANAPTAPRRPAIFLSMIISKKHKGRIAENEAQQVTAHDVGGSHETCWFSALRPGDFYVNGALRRSAERHRVFRKKSSGLIQRILTPANGSSSEPSARFPRPYFASGSGRIWICTARGFEPFPPSISHGTRSPLVLHRPRPFQPALGSSMRASRPLAKKPIG